jgi:hypothetical protein
MATYFIDAPGYDPVATFTRIHGCPPPGMPRRSSPQPSVPRHAQDERVDMKGDEADDLPRDGKGDPPHEGGGVDAAAASAQSAPTPDDPATPAAAPEPVPSERGEDPDGATAERHRLLCGWLDANWDAVMAMAREGVVPQMPQPLSPESEPAPCAPAPLPPVQVRKGDRWNRPKMTEFLRQLAATHSVSAAAKAVGMSRESAYRLRNRLKGQPFDVAWEAAFRQGYDNLAHAALDRAINGVEVPHYANGELVGTSRKFDERLTVALLAMRNRYGAPRMGRYGAAAEWWSERWDAMLERVGTGAIDWRDEQAALAQPLDEERYVAALIDKHAPDEGPVTPRRR